MNIINYQDKYVYKNAGWKFLNETAEGKSKDQAIKLGKRVWEKQTFTQKITLFTEIENVKTQVKSVIKGISPL